MIEVRNLTKKYGAHFAVSDLSFCVEQGQIYGFLGPNGAGKTTTMNIMTGYIGATEGDVVIDGYSIIEQPLEVKKRIGYLPEQPPLYLDMTAEEYLGFAASIKGIKKSDATQAVCSAMEITGIICVKDRLLKNLSKGYRQRVGLAQALLGMPPVIILDEPTVGLDPKQIIEMRELIKSLGKKHTVILSSHILSEVSAVCDKVMIISNGKLVACDTPQKLEEMMQTASSLELSVRASQEDCKKVIDKFKKRVTAVYEQADDICRIKVNSLDNSDMRDELFFAFAEQKLPIIDIGHAKATLEEVFLDLTSGDKTNDESEENTDESNH